ncbi:MAG: class I adenylate-forming enzyme family protein, partial [Actinomycetota bacterium]|nr:class I adenylate-forming enzyme family protein [Actinomycetota bacterium]
MTNFYEEYNPTFPSRANWNSPTVLRERAQKHPDKIYLDVPWTNESFSYAETLEAAERVGSGMLNAGASPGDRVLIMIPNCSAYILAWLGSSVGGLVEVPINTAYRGAFLAHQVSTTTPSIAVVSPEYVDRILDVSDAFSSIKHFYLVGDDADVNAGIEALSINDMDASPWSDLLSSEITELPEVKYSDLGSIFFTS